MRWESGAIGLFRATLDGRFTRANRTLAEMCGFSSVEEFMRHGLGARLADPQRKSQLVGELLKKGVVDDFKIPMKKKDGAILPISLSCELIRGDKGEPRFMGGIVQDIARHSKREETMRESEQKFWELFDSQPHGIMILDAETRRFEETNRPALGLFGYSKKQFLTLKVEDISSEKHQIMGALCRMRDEIHLRKRMSLDHFRRKDGSAFPGEMTAGLYTSSGRKRIILSIRDLSHQRKMEDELCHAQKMAAMGTIACSLAHDFNNILHLVLGFGSIMENEMRAGDPSMSTLKLLLATAQKGTHLTENLLSFSTKKTIRQVPININKVVHGMQETLGALLGDIVELEVSLSRHSLTVMADSAQIERVLMNLATNARDAMSKGGRLSIETKPVSLAGKVIQADEFGPPGRYVLISVTDSGPGMDEVTKKNLFEPFFTTKEIGKGTGLGLVIVDGIIKQHGGHIRVLSQKGQGTTFEIYLPLAKE